MNQADRDLKKLQNALLYTAKEIKRICDENHIKYTMIGGTLIGAVRHKGFIPWDDDIDFVMVRSEYNKFIHCCKTQLGPEFKLQTWFTDKHYCYAFAKILLKNTELITQTTQNVKFKRCIYVDIFPFDKVPSSKLEQIIQSVIIYLCIKVSPLKAISGFPKSFSKLKTFICIILKKIAMLIPQRLIIKICDKYMPYYSKTNSKYVTSMTGCYGYFKEMMPISIFKKYIELPFEDTTFMAISNYDYYLTKVFGDYMKLPPKEKRHHHDVLYVNYGPYENKF